MPQTTDVRAARWNRHRSGPDYNGDVEAILFLKSHGYTMTRAYTWVKPSFFYRPTIDEMDAICYLIEEWDYGGLESPPEPGPLVHEYEVVQADVRIYKE